MDRHARSLDRAATLVLLMGSVASFALVPRSAYGQLAEPAIQAIYGYFALLLALPLLRAAGRIDLERLSIAVFLALMPFVYVSTGARAAAGADLWLEAIGVALYGTLAVLGVRRSPWFLAIGVLGHGLGWDLWHLHRERTVPSWYALACAAIDASVAVYVVGRISAWRKLDALPNARG